MGRKVSKTRLLTELYDAAANSVGIPVGVHSVAVETFKLQVQQFYDLSLQRAELETKADQFLGDRDDYNHLRSIPGVGPIVAMIILAESGDLRRFSHYRQYLNYCGFNLSAQQSGHKSGQYHLSKRGNARLRYAYWLAATSAIRQRENSFRAKFARYIHKDPENPDLKRKGRVAVATKMARIAHALVKTGSDYRGFYEFSRGT